MDLNEIKKDILRYTECIDEIITKLESINSNTIIVGTGGSKVVAKFLSNILEKKNNIITSVMDARDLHHKNLASFNNIFIISYSGSNYGVKSSIIDGKSAYLLSHRKTKISNETLLHYEASSKKSFISLEATLIPNSILLRYYLGDNFAIILDEIFESIDASLTLELKGNHLNIFSGIETASSEEFITSTLVETGIKSPLVHEKYSYCHGRSTINKDHASSCIYLGYNNTDLDIKLKEVIGKTMANHLVMESYFEDPIINDYYLTLQSMVLLINIARAKKINLRSIKYDKEAVRNLYYFKGSM